jgi:hypothetical protein
MSTVNAFFLTYFVVMVLLMVRLEIVSRVRIKAIHFAYDQKDWVEANRKRKEHGEMGAQMLDLRKWTYSQFYPDLPKEQS